MAFDKNAFIADITKDSNLDDSAKQALTAVLDHPVLGQRIGESALRQSDYSRLANELNTKIKAASTYHESLTTWQAKEQARLDNERELLKKRLTDEGISLNELSEQTLPKDVVKREEMDKLAQDSVAYFSALSTIQMKYLKEFNDVLDLAKLHEIVQRDGVNINIAYERLIQPQREEKQQALFKEQLVKARQEGAEEALKNVQFPTAETPFSNGFGDPTPHALDHLTKKEGSPQYGAMVASKAYMADRRAGKVLG